MINVEQGLINSLLVLEILRNNEELKDIRVVVGTFTNAREEGLTFRMVLHGEGVKSFTWCVYEHRNSDEIIVNGRDGYICHNGELPYKNLENKYDYIKSFERGEYTKVADFLAQEFIRFNESEN